MNYIINRATKSHIPISAERSKHICNLTAILAVCLLLNGCVRYQSCDLAPAITGRILDKTFEEGIAGARITYKTNYAPYVNTAVTGKDGYFELDSITSRNVFFILPFLTIRIPFPEYSVDETENPVCYIKVEKSGYPLFSTLLESKPFGDHRKLSLYRHNVTLCRNADFTKDVSPKKKSSDSVYDNIFLFTRNNVLICLQKTSGDKPQ